MRALACAVIERAILDIAVGTGGCEGNRRNRARQSAEAQRTAASFLFSMEPHWRCARAFWFEAADIPQPSAETLAIAVATYALRAGDEQHERDAEAQRLVRLQAAEDGRD